jgi:hypothetical protein
MDRREAIAALVSMPALKALAVAEVKPTDVIVAECEGQLSIDAVEELQARLQQIWPGRKVVVCDEGIRLKVLREG